MGLPIPGGNNVVETFLAASKFGVLTKRQHFLSMAAKSLRNPGNIYLQAEIIHRESVLLRLKGNICDSQYRIQEFLYHSKPDPDLRSAPLIYNPPKIALIIMPLKALEDQQCRKLYSVVGCTPFVLNSDTNNRNNLQKIAAGYFIHS